MKQTLILFLFLCFINLNAQTEKKYLSCLILVTITSIKMLRICIIVVNHQYMEKLHAR